jgi:hypothetical protein
MQISHKKSHRIFCGSFLFTGLNYLDKYVKIKIGYSKSIYPERYEEFEE